MEILQNIYADLGGDNSLVIQFIVVMVLFVSLRYIFFNKLQYVIENRENKTVKQEQLAEETFEKAAELKRKYKERINISHQKAQKFLSEKNKNIVTEENIVYRKIEAELDEYISNARVDVVKEVEERRKIVLMEAAPLAEKLVEKIQQ